jgi:diaminopimelate epimerase
LGHGEIFCEIDPIRKTVTAHSIGYAVDPSPLVLSIGGRNWEGYRVRVLNPHFVLDGKEFPPNWREIAREMERAEAFPHRTNVEFLRRLARGRMELRIHERGVGETLSCGSGSIAAAAVAHEIFGHPDRLEVCMAGGSLEVQLEKNGATIRGPVSRIVPR